MTDAWDRFVGASQTSENAAYFETPAVRGAFGDAWWYAGDEPVVTIDRRMSPDELAGLTAQRVRSREAGALGYVGFDAVGLFEPALRVFPADAPFPLGEFLFAPQLRHERLPRGVRRVRHTGRPGVPTADSLPRGPFVRAVARLVRAIRDGEAFQVVLAHRRTWARPDDLTERAGDLRRAERFSFFYYLRFGDRVVLGASPESVAVLRGRTAWVDPIAGTIPAGPRHGRLPLASDPKELAEHRMLVDLARNDLGSIATAGSVRIPWRERRVRYSRVDHLVSRVQATLPAKVGPWELLAATFPAGTVSGAPKIRAVELLRAAEGTWRGPYGGAVGLLRPEHRASWALTIRSAFAAGRSLYTAAGAGVVHRSQPTREFDESLAKLSLVESIVARGADR